MMIKDKRKEWGSGIRDLPRANTRDSEKRWMDSGTLGRERNENKGGNDLFDGNAQKEKKR